MKTKAIISLLPLFALCFAPTMVMPASADTKIDDVRERLPISGTVEVEGMEIYYEGSVRYHATSWERQAGDYRILFEQTANVRLFFEGEWIGTASLTVVQEMITPDLVYWDHFTWEENFVVRILGEGAVWNYHFVTVYEHGVLVAYHMVGEPFPVPGP